MSAALLLRDDGHGDLHEHVCRVPALAQLPPAHHCGVLPVVAPVQPAAWVDSVDNVESVAREASISVLQSWQKCIHWNIYTLLLIKLPISKGEGISDKCPKFR